MSTGAHTSGCGFSTTCPLCIQKGQYQVAALQWDSIDNKAVDTARLLAADAVEKVGNGHPGTA
ncbi:hypothetical protein, partial [Cryobacterium sp. TMT2-23]|uniref:hypothetical protein n=1 Tax=Cryobacterium sp. TMT2-23 TaxID=1259252 RepID=UPI0035179B25